MVEQVTADEVFRRLKENEGITRQEGKLLFEMADVEVQVDSKDVIGRVLEDWLGQWLKDNNIQFTERENSQLPPDFFLSDEFERDKMLEVKAFDSDRGPAFDIADFVGYCDDIREKPQRLDADYIIFEYSMNNGTVEITRMWMKKVWEIARPSNKWSVNVQVKRGEIYNLRPATWYSSRARFQPFSSREEFVKALHETLLQYDKVDNDKYEDWFEEVKENYEDASGEALDSDTDLEDF